MEIFLPIAHMDVNVLLILCFGAVVGFLSGLVGVGGGFLITPLLIFIGVTPIVAVATGSAQIAGTAASGSYVHWRLGNVDFRMAFSLLAGSWVGAAAGVYAARQLQRSGHFGNTVVLLYVLLLGFIGLSMLYESAGSILRRGPRPSGPAGQGDKPSARLGEALERLPGAVDYPTSGLRISFLVPVGLGVAVGALTSLMGVGGGFVMVPMMIYLLRMPTRVVVGTSLFQLLFTTAAVSVMQAGVNHSVDPFLALILILGSALGTQWGARLGIRLPAERLRLVLALLVVAVAAKMLSTLLITPDEVYTMVRVVR
ncbi:MAG: sulfite exporter TauE/SafE family protein [Chromatiaceae bacterium]